MIAAGSTVRITDHSYHVDLTPKGHLKQARKIGGYHSETKLRVVAIGCDFPIITKPETGLDHHGLDGSRNNTLVFDETLNIYFFTQARFLREVCSHCGR